MADDQSNVSEEESSIHNKKENTEEVSSDQETDDEILNTDIMKEMSEIEKDREKFEKDFAQLLSTTEGNTAEDEEEQEADEEESDENFGILLPRSPNFGPSKPLITGTGDEEKTPEPLPEEDEIIEKEDSIDTQTEEIEIIAPEEELISPESPESESEDKTEDAQEQSDEKKVKPGFVDKIKNIFKQTEMELDPYDPEIHGPITEFKGEEGYEEIERYWVNEPYAFIVILFNEDRNSHLYYIVEPELTDFEHTFLLEIKDRLRDVLLVEEINEEEDDKEAVLESKIRSIIKDYTIEITPPMLEKISYYIKRDFVRFGKIDALMMDDSIEDVSGNGHDVPIFLYHRAHQNIATNVVYEEDELNSFIIQMAQRSGKHISVAEPMVDATMPDGSRIQMTLGTSVTAHGSTFTIRKFSDTPITPVDLIKWGTFSSESMAYLWLCIENNKSLIYAGGTASGKTSSLNAVSLFIPEKAKVITLEDTRELKLPHPNWIPSITRDSFTADERGAVDMYDLLKAALRQRPEFLLVGEVRGKEALTLFQAMSTGHTTFSTMHADSVASAIHRLENPPISVPRTMIQALDIMSIQSQTYTKGKRVRRNIKLVEIVDIDPNTRNIRTNDIFVWDSEADVFVRTGESKALFDIKMRRGWAQGKVDQELYYRQKILEYMVENGINDFQEISDIINAYQSTPEKVLKKLQLE
ncbi:MAG: archaeal flagellar protein FlaI [Methanolobus sp.]|jgi:flagellar protein FlaI|uniref:type II/IV secretion system ATPase subunit n=1 Tax=Methanolobus sp. TaxID=1874737 RepID=UPI0024AC3B6C|nr:type II/IV secretion system ATPase subunit [Methanolobus sp.]MDI3486350.1 archaeal flagellar protein FlaI [Methanolobus sp.]MDK2831085.1 archaeal flagellar protein FlaI [Methanolobus sp.]MDK2938786.1 archaeal flagellar protein FlaI [Methanolobus sp.]